MDNSREMLDRLLEKAPEAQAVLCDLEAYQPTRAFRLHFHPLGVGFPVYGHGDLQRHSAAK